MLIQRTFIHLKQLENDLEEVETSCLFVADIYLKIDLLKGIAKNGFSMGI